MNGDNNMSAQSSEITVSSTGGLTNLVTQAAELLHTSRAATISAINSAIPHAVQLAELLKHRVKGLHQVNKFERVTGSNKTRVTIQLSLEAIETDSTGYQAPIPAEQVEEKSLEELKTPPVITRTENREYRPRPPRTYPNELASKEQSDVQGNRPYRGRPSYRGGRPSDRGGRPTERGGRPSYRGDRPSYRGDRPSYRGDRPTERGERPTERGDRPTERGDRPTERGDRTTERGERGGFRGGRRARGRGGYAAGATHQGERGQIQRSEYEGFSRPITTNVTPKEKNEVRISSRVPARAYFRETVLLFKEFNNDTVVLKASGTALPNAVRVVEDVKRSIGGLYQVNHFDRKKVEEVWKSNTEGVEDKTEERFVPSLEITLSLKPLESSEPGYQEPLPASEVKEISLEEAKNL